MADIVTPQCNDSANRSKSYFRHGKFSVFSRGNERKRTITVKKTGNSPVFFTVILNWSIFYMGNPWKGLNLCTYHTIFLPKCQVEAKSLLMFITAFSSCFHLKFHLWCDREEAAIDSFFYMVPSLFLISKLYLRQMCNISLKFLCFVQNFGTKTSWQRLVFRVVSYIYFCFDFSLLLQPSCAPSQLFIMYKNRRSFSTYAQFAQIFVFFAFRSLNYSISIYFFLFPVIAFPKKSYIYSFCNSLLQTPFSPHFSHFSAMSSCLFSAFVIYCSHIPQWFI